ncbi:hypothetical protein FHW71_000612 [Enterobacter sp. Sphag1F]|nr:hypothetical protein [Enterobacter sp. Sphag1F]NYI12786.1 hypothetical protein [Enterobacter sp. Sphag71]
MATIPIDKDGYNAVTPSPAARCFHFRTSS